MHARRRMSLLQYFHYCICVLLFFSAHFYCFDDAFSPTQAKISNPIRRRRFFYHTSLLCDGIILRAAKTFCMHKIVDTFDRRRQGRQGLGVEFSEIITQIKVYWKRRQLSDSKITFEDLCVSQDGIRRSQEPSHVFSTFSVMNVTYFMSDYVSLWVKKK